MREPMKRPESANADEWHLYLDWWLYADDGQDKPPFAYVAVQIAEAIEGAGITERERLAKEVEALLPERFYEKRPDARMALAIAASVVRRGRRLTAGEQLQNLKTAMDEA
jgi:hypothetical protein